MNIKEMNEQNWIVSKDLEVFESEEGGYANIEQECGILILREGIKDINKQEIQIQSNNQIYITKLSKSEYFILERIEVSKNIRNKGYILRVEGTLENKGLTIRNKKPVFSEEEKLARSERAKVNLIRTKNNNNFSTVE